MPNLEWCIVYIFGTGGGISNNGLLSRPLCGSGLEKAIPSADGLVAVSELGY